VQSPGASWFLLGMNTISGLLLKNDATIQMDIVGILKDMVSIEMITVNIATIVNYA
jgi:hypothetical protein